ncbi:MAG: hypothetical protein AB1489_07535 [Acidobacteriota bacterium]
MPMKNRGSAYNPITYRIIGAGVLASINKRYPQLSFMNKQCGRHGG